MKIFEGFDDFLFEGKARNVENIQNCDNQMKNIRYYIVGPTKRGAPSLSSTKDDAITMIMRNILVTQYPNIIGEWENDLGILRFILNLQQKNLY